MSDDIANKKIEELRQKAKESFSSEEVDSFINMGKIIASKVVLTMLTTVIEEGPIKHSLDQKECAKLVKKIKATMPYNYAGFVQCSFKEIPFSLNISLSLVNKGYKTDVHIPHADYTSDLFEKYNLLKQLAVAYWRQYAEDNSALFKRICNYRADIDFSNLIIDPQNPTTLYLDPQSEKRVGIFCYYVDQNGKPFYKK